jgi:PKD repeat protein
VTVVTGTPGGGTSNAKAFLVNGKPAVSSAASATPNPAYLKQKVAFAIGAADPENKKLAVTWSMGDGNTLAGETLSYAYAVAGTYSVTVTVTDAEGASVSATLQVVVLETETPDNYDTDKDGVPDVIELALGTDPTKADSSPITNAANPLPANVGKVGISLNFTAGGKDGVSAAGALSLPATFVVQAGAKVGVDVGGVVNTFTLDAKGKSTNIKGFALATKPSKGLSKFALKLSKGTFRKAFEDEGMTDKTVKNQPVQNFVVKLIFNGTLYQTTKVVTYTATQGKSGKAAGK